MLELQLAVAGSLYVAGACGAAMSMRQMVEESIDQYDPTSRTHRRIKWLLTYGVAALWPWFFVMAGVAAVLQLGADE